MRVDDDVAGALERARDAATARCGELDDDFARRLDAHFGVLHARFRELSGERDDALEQLVAVVADAAESWLARDDELKVLDAEREGNGDWFQSNRMLGGRCDVRRFAGDLAGLREQLPYFAELGLSWLHLEQLFRRPEGGAGDGRAASSYREVDPRLGTMANLAELTRALRDQGMSASTDFVVHRISAEHEWARRAAAGDPDHDDFSLAPAELELNSANPAVFRAVVGEMLCLANQGIEVLRIDTGIGGGPGRESPPDSHALLRAMNAVARIAAPALLFAAGPTGHPCQPADSIAVEECPLGDNTLLTALGWEALATRDPRLLACALERRHELPEGTAWITSVRDHDDLGWTLCDEDAAELGIDPTAHRRWLSDFYLGRVDDSFARGLASREDPETGELRVSGTTASLAGVEARQPAGLERALLLYSIAMSTGGVPLITLGDEVAQLNDYRELEPAEQADDSRWAHRPRRPAERYELRGDDRTVPGWMFSRLRHLVEVRQATPEFAGNRLIGFDAHHPNVLGYQRPGDDGAVLVLVNFGDEPAEISGLTLSGSSTEAEELVTGSTLELGDGLTVPAHRFVWLRVRPRG